MAPHKLSDLVDEPEQGSIDLLHSFLRQHPLVEFIRYQYVDVGNVLRCHVLTRERALALGNKPTRASPTCFAYLPTDEFNISTFGPVGFDELLPDWRSLRVCTYVGDGTTHASVMCFVHERNGAFAEWKRDPRTILQRTLKRAETHHGLQFLAGFELEFALLQGEQIASATVPSSHFPSVYCGARTLRESKPLAIIEDIMRALKNAGIEATHFHAESGAGMFEIPTGPLRPLDAVDTLVFTKEAISAIAKKHGMTATLYPKPLSQEHANGGHCHLSIDSISETDGEHFLAGMLDNLPALCAFSMPQVDSYDRIGDLKSTTGSRVGWGTENKDVAIRKVLGTTGYWEVRCADFTANFYYALAGWITAGIEGLEKKTDLRWQDPPGLVGLMTPEEVAALGWTTELPTSLEIALKELETAIGEGRLSDLGTDFLTMFLGFKHCEMKDLSKKTDEERMLAYLEMF